MLSKLKQLAVLSVYKVSAYLKITKLFNLMHRLPTLLGIEKKEVYSFSDITLQNGKMSSSLKVLGEFRHYIEMKGK